MKNFMDIRNSSGRNTGKLGTKINQQLVLVCEYYMILANDIAEH